MAVCWQKPLMLLGLFSMLTCSKKTFKIIFHFNAFFILFYFLLIFSLILALRLSSFVSFRVLEFSPGIDDATETQKHNLRSNQCIFSWSLVDLAKMHILFSMTFVLQCKLQHSFVSLSLCTIISVFAQNNDTTMQVKERRGTMFFCQGERNKEELLTLSHFFLISIVWVGWEVIVLLCSCIFSYSFITSKQWLLD